MINEFEHPEMSQEEYNAIMNEFHYENDALIAIQKRKSNRIMAAITMVKGPEFAADLLAFLKEIACSGEIDLVHQTQGTYQAEELGCILGMWVDQYGWGDSGDCFYGWCYFQLKPNMWLKAHFAD